MASAAVTLATAAPAAAQIQNPRLTILGTPPVGWPEGHAELKVETFTVMDAWWIDLRVNDVNQSTDGYLNLGFEDTNHYTGMGQTEEGGWIAIDCAHSFSGLYYLPEVNRIYAQYKFRWTRTLSDGTNTSGSSIRPAAPFSYIQP